MTYYHVDALLTAIVHVKFILIWDLEILLNVRATLNDHLTHRMMTAKIAESLGRSYSWRQLHNQRL